jgi:hypothetical protein
MKKLILLFLIFGITKVQSQDLMDLFGDSTKTEYADAFFKTTRIINSQSIENPPEGELIFIIGHRFGQINEGIYSLFGIDNATIRFGLEYGITDRLAVGFGRSVYQKTYDGFVKYNIFRQSSGYKNFPVSVSWFSSMAVNTLKFDNKEKQEDFNSRLSYVHQLMIARKFSNSFTFQVSPTLVHKNLVPEKVDENDILSIGTGARYKITNRIAITGEYYYVLPNQINSYDYFDALALGVDLETGGHVFQLHVTNAAFMFEKAFITDTMGNAADGDLYFGFNITRVFNIK